MTNTSNCRNENLWEALGTGRFDIIQTCIYRQFSAKAAARVRRILRGASDDDVREIFQESLVRVLDQQIRDKKIEEKPFEGYFFRTLRNYAIDVSKKRSKIKPYHPEEMPETAHPDNHWEAALMALGKEVRRHVFPRLTEDDQKIMDLVIVRELSYKVITEQKIFVNEQGEPLSQDYLRVKQARAMENLRALIVQYFLERSQPFSADSRCPDLLRDHYVKKTALEQMKKVHGDRVTDYLARCLSGLTLSRLDAF